MPTVHYRPLGYFCLLRKFFFHLLRYISAVFSPKRRVALELIDEFVEDFKANAPIWKYDVIDGKRIYAADRSTPMDGSGLLA